LIEVQNIMGSLDHNVELKINGVTLKRQYRGFAVIDERGVQIESGDYAECYRRFQEYTGFGLDNRFTPQSICEGSR
jgi:hypothetical protein